MREETPHVFHYVIQNVLQLVHGTWWALKSFLSLKKKKCGAFPYQFDNS